MLLKIYDKINNLKLPKHWEEEGISPPNETAKQNACQLCYTLFFNYKLKPSFIACTVVNGIYIKYKGNNISLIIEVDNEGDIGLLVNNEYKREIICNEDIDNIEKIEKSNCINIFTRYTKISE